jgi:hypothetical protein
MQELDVIFQLIIDSYNFVTGLSIQADKLVKSHEVVM